MVALAAPDGSIVETGIAGRGQHGLTSPKVSRRQFSIEVKDQDTLLLKNLGQNGRQCSSIWIQAFSWARAGDPCICLTAQLD